MVKFFPVKELQGVSSIPALRAVVLNLGDLWPCLEIFLVVIAWTEGDSIACNEWRPGMLLDTSQCTGQVSNQRLIQTRMPRVPMLRNPGLEAFTSRHLLTAGLVFLSRCPVPAHLGRCLGHIPSDDSRAWEKIPSPAPDTHLSLLGQTEPAFQPEYLLTQPPPSASLCLGFRLTDVS